MIGGAAGLGQLASLECFVTGGQGRVDLDGQWYDVTVQLNPDRTYKTIKVGGYTVFLGRDASRNSCTCHAFRFHPSKPCKHIQGIERIIKELSMRRVGKRIPDAYELETICLAQASCGEEVIGKTLYWIEGHLGILWKRVKTSGSEPIPAGAVKAKLGDRTVFMAPALDVHKELGEAYYSSEYRPDQEARPEPAKVDDKNDPDEDEEDDFDDSMAEAADGELVFPGDI